MIRLRLLLGGSAFLLACGGLYVGNYLRSGVEEGAIGTPTEFYASAEATADSVQMGGGVTATSYFDGIRQVLLNEFVDPILNETSLSRGAVRGMIRQLDDPNSRFYEPTEWRAYLARLNGDFTGIGADLAPRPSGDSLPLKVISIADGGPADRAGLKPGDWIDEIDEKWVASRALLKDFEAALQRRDRKEITQLEFSKTFEALRQKAQRMMNIDQALTELQVGTGSVRLKVIRDGKPFDVTVMREQYKLPNVEMRNGTVVLRSFAQGVAEQLRSAITSDSITLDVRSNPGGPIEEVERCLQLLLQPGTYAKVQREPKEKPQSTAIKMGRTSPLKITVIVDRGTAREAEAFVAALRDVGKADVQGGPTAGMPFLTRRVTLADGSGYTLTSGHFLDAEGDALK